MSKRKRIVSDETSLQTDYCSSENSTNTPPSADHFEGVFVRCTQYNSLNITVTSDTPGIINLIYSFDGVNTTDVSPDQPTLANDNTLFILPLPTPYVKVRWESSDIPNLTTLHIYTVLKKAALPPEPPPSLSNEGPGTQLLDLANYAVKSLTSLDNTITITDNGTSIDLAGVANGLDAITNEGSGAHFWDAPLTSIRSLMSSDNSINVTQNPDHVDIKTNAYINSTSPGLAVADLRYSGIPGFTTNFAGVDSPITPSTTLFTSSNFEGLPYFDSPQNGRLRFIGNRARFFGVTVCISGALVSGASATWKVTVRKNGNLVNSSVSYFTTGTTTTVYNISSQCGVLLNPNDYIEVYGQNTSSTSEVNVESYNLMIIGDGDSIISANSFYTSYLNANSTITLVPSSTNQNAIIPQLSMTQGVYQNVSQASGIITFLGTSAQVIRVIVKATLTSSTGPYLIGVLYNGTAVLTAPSQYAARSDESNDAFYEGLLQVNPGDTLRPFMNIIGSAASATFTGFRVSLYSVNNMGFYITPHITGYWKNTVQGTWGQGTDNIQTYDTIYSSHPALSYTANALTFTALQSGTLTFNSILAWGWTGGTPNVTYRLLKNGVVAFAQYKQPPTSVTDAQAMTVNVVTGDILQFRILLQINVGSMIHYWYELYLTT